MSLAIKVSTIRQAELAINRLNDNMRNTRAQLERNMAEATQRARREAEATARREAERMRNDFDRKLANGLQGVEAGVRLLDEEQRRRLQALANNVNNALNGLEGELRKEFNSGLNKLESRVDARLRSQQSTLDAHGRQLDAQGRQIADLTSTVEGILNHIADLGTRRREALELVRGSYASATAAVDIARFCPEESADIRRRLAAVEANPDSEGTVALATDLIIRIQSAAEEATRCKMIYDAIRTQALENLRTVLGEVNSNRITRVPNPADASDVAELETDFWSRGEYSAVQTELENLERELATEPSLERVKEIGARTAELHERAENLVQAAARQAILSENRVTVTEDIVTALRRQGWEIERRADGTDAVDFVGGEVDADWREGFFAVVKSAQGDNISIVVEPDENGLENRLVFHRNDKRPMTGAEYLNTVRRICEQISQSGHKVEAPHAPADGGNHAIPELADAGALTRKGAAAKIRQRARN